MTNQEFPTNEPTAATEHTSEYVTETAPATHSEVETTYSSNADSKVKGSFAASTWVALIAGFLLLIVLIVFILQNQQKVPMNFLNWSGEFPAGIAYLIFAIAGALIMALVGMWRMFELRRQVRKQAKQHR